MIGFVFSRPESGQEKKLATLLILCEYIFPLFHPASRAANCIFSLVPSPYDLVWHNGPHRVGSELLDELQVNKLG